MRRHAVNLQQRVAELFQRVREHGGRLPFSSLLYRDGRRLSREEVLVSFLALLELVRQGSISAWQQGALGEIFLVARSEATAAFN